jgi:hypothetical protein
LQLSVGKKLFQVLVDGSHIHVVEDAHHFLSQPNVLVGINHLDPTLTLCGDEGEVFDGGGARDGGFLVAGLLFHPYPPSWGSTEDDADGRGSLFDGMKRL